MPVTPVSRWPGSYAGSVSQMDVWIVDPVSNGRSGAVWKRLAPRPRNHRFSAHEKNLRVLHCDRSVWRTRGLEILVPKPTKAGAWLARGLVNYGKHFGSREFWRNNFNVTSLGAAISVVDQIWINGKMTLPEVIRSRLIATVVDLAGAGDAMVSGHGELLRLCKITPDTPDWKRRAAEWPVMFVGVAAWNLAQYFIVGVAASHYLRSVCVSTVVGVAVQVGVLRANAILNNYATGDPKFCENISGRWSRMFGCQVLSARAKRRLYWGAIAGLNAFMFINWAWGEKLRHAVLGH